MSYFGSTNYLIEVARGNVPGAKLIDKFGQNDTVSTTIVPICAGGHYETPTTSVTLAAISDDVADTAAGAGAQSITLEYLDSNFDEQMDTIAMNGTTETTETVLDVIRLNRAYVAASGTYATAAAPSQAGSITIQVSGAGTIWTVIPEIGTTGNGVGNSLIGVYTVPAGKTAYLLNSDINVESNKIATIYLFARDNADDVTTPFSPRMLQQTYVGVAGQVSTEHKAIHKYLEKTDIGFMGTATATANISVSFDLLVIDN